MIKSFLILLSVLSFNNARAEDSLSRPDFWRDVRALVMSCAVQPYEYDIHGQRVALPIRSICSELRVREDGVTMLVRGKPYQAFMTESNFSDGGDLFDLFVRDADGELRSYRLNVPAFGDIVLGLIGGESGIVREE